MTSTTDKIAAMANEATGAVKQALGKATGNDKLKTEGEVQQQIGEAQAAVANAKDGMKKLVDRM